MSTSVYFENAKIDTTGVDMNKETVRIAVIIGAIASGVLALRYDMTWMVLALFLLFVAVVMERDYDTR